jgi:hypothetical protein
VWWCEQSVEALEVSRIEQIRGGNDGWMNGE